MSDLKFLVVLLLVLFASGNGHAKQHMHKHKTSLPEECLKQPDKPSIKCAPVVNAKFDKQGRLWRVWTNGNYIYVQHGSVESQKFSKPVRVNSTAEMIAARGENRPKLAFDIAGRIFISWTQKIKQRYSGHIRFSRSVDDGKTFSTPVTVNNHLAPTSHRFESMAVNREGHIYIAWLDKRDQLESKKQNRDYKGAAVYFALSTNHGESFQFNRKIVDHSCECCRTTMAIDLDQYPVMMWRHIYGDNIRDHALVKLKSNGIPGEVQRISHDNWKIAGCPHHGPALNIDNDGRYHMTWFNNAPQRHGLFYAYSDHEGKKLSVPVSFGNYQAQASHPQVISHGANIYLAWQEYDGEKLSLMVMHSGDKGQNWSKPESMADSKTKTDYPLLLQNGKDVYVAWHRPGHDYSPIKLPVK